MCDEPYTVNQRLFINDSLTNQLTYLFTFTSDFNQMSLTESFRNVIFRLGGNGKWKKEQGEEFSIDFYNRPLGLIDTGTMIETLTRRIYSLFHEPVSL